MGTTIIRDIPDELHKAFKMMCLEKDTSMNAELIRLIKQAVEEYKRRKL